MRGAWVRETLRREGAAAVVRAVLRATLSYVCRTNRALWFRRDLRETVSGSRALPSVEVVFEAQERVAAWIREQAARYPWIHDEHEERVAFEQGHLCPFAVIGDEIVGYVKIGVGRVYVADFGRLLHLPPKDAFIYDTFVLPRYRGRRIAYLMVARAAERLCALGYERVWCHIPEWNAPSLRTYRAAGFRAVSVVRFVRILWLGFYSRNPEKMIWREALASRMTAGGRAAAARC